VKNELGWLWKEVGCEHEKTVSTCLLGSLGGLTMGTVWGICSFTLFLSWPAVDLSASGYCVVAVVMNCHTLVWESKSLAALLLLGIVVIHSQLDQENCHFKQIPCKQEISTYKKYCTLYATEDSVCNTLYTLA